MGDPDPDPDAVEPVNGALFALVDGLPSRRLSYLVVVLDPVSDTFHELSGAGADIHGVLSDTSGPLTAHEVFDALGRPSGGDTASVERFLADLVDLGVARRVR